MATWTKSFLTEFIQHYKSEECLWRLKHPDYNNRQATKEAYDRMLDKYQRYDPSADRLVVARKIMNLRTVFRREHNKVRDAREAGQEYTPRLWYYSLMEFVTHQEPRKGDDSRVKAKGRGSWNPKHSQDDNIEDWEVSDLSPGMKLECYDSSAVDSPGNDEDDENETQELDSRHEIEALEMDGLSDACELVPESTANSELYNKADPDHGKPIVHKPQHSRPERKRKRRRVEASDHVSNHHQSNHRVNDSLESERPDNSAIFGSNVAAKLRTMEREQRIYTERLINEALFYGELGQMNIQSRVVVSEKCRPDPTNIEDIHKEG